MEGHLSGNLVIVGEDAKQRFHDSRGYGVPQNGNKIALDPIEAAHLLLRGDLDTVDGMDFTQFISKQKSNFSSHFSTYIDLRFRGFHLTPVGDSNDSHLKHIDFTVYERGTKPPGGIIKYNLRVIRERSTIIANELGGCVLAIVDEEGELTYLNTTEINPIGKMKFSPPLSEGILLKDNVLLKNSDPSLHESGFFGQHIPNTSHIQLSLVEAAYLSNCGVLSVNGNVIDQGRTIEGNLFDHRLLVYTTLRKLGLVPKTGFKFGFDFRVYQDFNTTTEALHSEYLVKIVENEHTFSTKELSLNVRLAVGVRKRTLFAIVDGSNNIRWILVESVTP